MPATGVLPPEAPEPGGEIGFDSVLAALSRSGSSHAELKGQLQRLVGRGGPDQEELRSATQERVQRRVNYESAKKETSKKWVPQVSFNRNVEQLRFGDAPVRSGMESITALSASFQAANAFERELSAALAASSVTEANPVAAKALPMSQKLAKQKQDARAARLRSILFEEHRKRHRLNKIKSRAWRRLNRKSQTIEREKLLSRLEEESPEVVAKIRTDLAQRQAEMRLWKQQTARRKWAKVALRFGGRDMQKEIGQQMQAEQDDKKSLARVLAKGGIGGGKGAASDTDSDCESDDSEIPDEGGPGTGMEEWKKAVSRAVQSGKKEGPVNDVDGVTPSLMKLGFMKRAAEKEKQLTKEAEEAVMEDLKKLQKVLKGTGKEAGDADSGSSDDENQEKSATHRSDEREDARRQHRLPTISAEDLRKAAESMGDCIPRFRSLEEEDREKQRSHCSEGKERGDHDDKEGAEARSERAGGKGGDCGRNEAEVEKEGKRRKRERDEEVAGPSLSNIDDLIKSLASDNSLNDDAAVQQQELVKQAFVETGGAAAEVQEEIQELIAEDKEEATPTRTAKLPGWGSWTGEGIKTPKKKQSQARTTPTRDQTNVPTVYINRKLDHKLAPYFVQEVPHPFTSKEHFEAARAHPLGPEWNTMQVHHRLVQSKVYVRPGSVILPLEYAKHLPENIADSLLDAWDSRKKKRGPLARL